MGDDLTAEEIAAIVEQARADSLVWCRENRAAEERRYAEVEEKKNAWRRGEIAAYGHLEPLRVAKAWRPRSDRRELFHAVYQPVENHITAAGAHTGWALTGSRVPDFPDPDHQDGMWLDVRNALAADVDYVEILADAPNLSSPWGLTNRHKAAA